MHKNRTFHTGLPGVLDTFGSRNAVKFFQINSIESDVAAAIFVFAASCPLLHIRRSNKFCNKIFWGDDFRHFNAQKFPIFFHFTIVSVTHGSYRSQQDLSFPMDQERMFFV